MSTNKLDDAALVQELATYTTGSCVVRVVSQDYIKRIQDRTLEVAALKVKSLEGSRTPARDVPDAIRALKNEPVDPDEARKLKELVEALATAGRKLLAFSPSSVVHYDSLGRLIDHYTKKLPAEPEPVVDKGRVSAQAQVGTMLLNSGDAAINRGEHAYAAELHDALDAYNAQLRLVRTPEPAPTQG